MFPQSQFLMTITLTNDEPLFGFEKGQPIQVNLLQKPDPSEICVVADRNGHYTIRRYECINGKPSLWPPLEGVRNIELAIRGKMMTEVSESSMTA